MSTSYSDFVDAGITSMKQCDQDISKVTDLISPIVKAAVNTAEAAIDADKFPSKTDGPLAFTARGQRAAVVLDDYITAAYLLIYGIPMTPIEDKPEKWIELTNHPKLGHELVVAFGLSITINKVEIHADTAANSFAEVLRFNGDSALTCMPYGCIIEEYASPSSKTADRSFGVNCFIQEYPFKMPMPIVLEVYKDRAIGMLSDITHRFAVLVDDLESQAYSPSGTKLFPNIMTLDNKKYDIHELIVPNDIHEIATPKQEDSHNEEVHNDASGEETDHTKDNA